MCRESPGKSERLGRGSGRHSVRREWESQCDVAVKFTRSCAKAKRKSAPQSHSGAAQRARLGFAFNREIHGGDDVAVELDRDGKFANRLDGVVELDLALVDGVALRGERIGNVG